MRTSFKKKFFANTRRGILFLFSSVVATILVFGAASFAYSQLRVPDMEETENPTQALTSKQRQQNTVPVHPEGFACRAYTDYLDLSAQMEPEKTPEETYKQVEKLQEPVKEKVAEVEEESFKEPFNEYFDFHMEYTYNLIDSKETADTEKMEGILNQIAEVCSTPVALETVPVEK